MSLPTLSTHSSTLIAALLLFMSTSLQVVHAAKDDIMEPGESKGIIKEGDGAQRTPPPFVMGGYSTCKSKAGRYYITTGSTVRIYVTDTSAIPGDANWVQLSLVPYKTAQEDNWDSANKDNTKSIEGREQAPQLLANKGRPANPSSSSSSSSSFVVSSSASVNASHRFEPLASSDSVAATNFQPSAAAQTFPTIPIHPNIPFVTFLFNQLVFDIPLTLPFNTTLPPLISYSLKAVISNAPAPQNLSITAPPSPLTTNLTFENAPPPSSFTFQTHPSQSPIYFLSPGLSCPSDDVKPSDIPLQYILPPIAGFFLICGLVFAWMWWRLRKLQLRELKGKFWAHGPHSPENLAAEMEMGAKKEGRWSVWLRGVLFKGMERKIRKRKQRDLEEGEEEEEEEEGGEEGKLEVEGGKDEVKEEKKEDPSTVLIVDERGTPAARLDLSALLVAAPEPAFRGSADTSTTTRSSTTSKRTFGDNMHTPPPPLPPASVTRAAPTTTTTTNKILKSLFSKPSKVAPPPLDPPSADSSSSDTDSTKLEPQPLLAHPPYNPLHKGLKIVLDSESDTELGYSLESNKPRTLRIRTDPPPERFTGSSSKWTPPFPDGTLFRVLVPFLPKERDEVRLERGEIVKALRFFEDGWCVVAKAPHFTSSSSSSSEEDEEPTTTTTTGGEGLPGGVIQTALGSLPKGGFGSMLQSRLSKPAPASALDSTGGAFGLSSFSKKGKEKMGGREEERLGEEFGKGVVPFNCLYYVPGLEVVVEHMAMMEKLREAERKGGRGRGEEDVMGRVMGVGNESKKGRMIYPSVASTLFTLGILQAVLAFCSILLSCIWRLVSIHSFQPNTPQPDLNLFACVDAFGVLIVLAAFVVSFLSSGELGGPGLGMTASGATPQRDGVAFVTLLRAHWAHVREQRLWNKLNEKSEPDRNTKDLLVRLCVGFALFRSNVLTLVTLIAIVGDLYAPMLVTTLGMLSVGYASMTIEVVRWVKQTTGRGFEEEDAGTDRILGRRIVGRGQRGGGRDGGLRACWEGMGRKWRDGKLGRGGWEEEWKEVVGLLGGVEGEMGVEGKKMIGRDRELGQVMARLRGLIQGDMHHFGQGVIVMGDTGMGKSNLLDAFQTESAPLNVRVARCKARDPSFSPSFSTISSLTQTLFAALDLGKTPSERSQALRNLQLKDETRPLLPLLNLVLECGIPESDTSRFKMHNRGLTRCIANVLLQVLRAKMGKMIQVVAFVVDDVQWCDPLSMDVLAQLIPASKAASLPIFLLLSATKFDVDTYPINHPLSTLLSKKTTEIIQLNPLSDTDSNTLFQHGLGSIQSTLSPTALDSFKTSLLAKSNGNPLLITQLTNNLVHDLHHPSSHTPTPPQQPAHLTQTPTRTSTTTPLAIPPEILDQLLTPLLPEESDLALFASCVGPQMDAEMVYYVWKNALKGLGTPDMFVGCLKGLVRKGIWKIVQQDERVVDVCWTHGVLQEGVYRKVNSVKRNQAHGLCVAFLASRMGGGDHADSGARWKDVRTSLRIGWHQEQLGSKEMAGVFYVVAVEQSYKSSPLLIRRDILYHTESLFQNPSYKSTIPSSSSSRHSVSVKDLLIGTLELLLLKSSRSLNPSLHTTHLERYATSYISRAVPIPVQSTETGWWMQSLFCLWHLHFSSPSTPGNTGGPKYESGDRRIVLRKAGGVLVDLVSHESLTLDPSYHRALVGYLNAVGLLESNGASVEPLLKAYAQLQHHLCMGGYIRARDKIIKKGRLLLCSLTNQQVEKYRGAVAYFEGMIGLGFAMSGEFEMGMAFLASGLVLGDQLTASYALSEMVVWQVVVSLQAGLVRQAMGMLHDAQYYNAYLDPTDPVTKRRLRVLALMVLLYTSTDSSLTSNPTTSVELNSLLQSLSNVKQSTLTEDDMLGYAVACLFEARQGNLAQACQLLQTAFTVCQVALKACWTPVSAMSVSLLLEATLRSWLAASYGQQKDMSLSTSSMSNVGPSNGGGGSTYLAAGQGYSNNGNNNLSVPSSSFNNSKSSGNVNGDTNLLCAFDQHLQTALSHIRQAVKHAPWLAADLAFAEAVMIRIQNQRHLQSFRRSLCHAAKVAKRYQRRWWEGMAAAQSYSIFGFQDNSGRYGANLEDFRAVEKEIGCVYMPFPLVVMKAKTSEKGAGAYRTVVEGVQLQIRRSQKDKQQPKPMMRRKASVVDPPVLTTTTIEMISPSTSAVNAHRIESRRAGFAVGGDEDEDDDFDVTIEVENGERSRRRPSNSDSDDDDGERRLDIEARRAFMEMEMQMEQDDGMAGGDYQNLISSSLKHQQHPHYRGAAGVGMGIPSRASNMITSVGGGHSVTATVSLPSSVSSSYVDDSIPGSLSRHYGPIPPTQSSSHSSLSSMLTTVMSSASISSTMSAFPNATVSSASASATFPTDGSALTSSASASQLYSMAGATSGSAVGVPRGVPRADSSSQLLRLVNNAPQGGSSAGGSHARQHSVTLAGPSAIKPTSSLTSSLTGAAAASSPSAASISSPTAAGTAGRKYGYRPKSVISVGTAGSKGSASTVIPNQIGSTTECLIGHHTPFTLDTSFMADSGSTYAHVRRPSSSAQLGQLSHQQQQENSESLDGQLSLFFRSRMLVCDSSRWMPFHGMVAVSIPELTEKWCATPRRHLDGLEINIQINCILVLSAAFSSYVERTLFSDSISIPMPHLSALTNTCRVPFAFDFNTKVLPPSLHLVTPHQSFTHMPAIVQMLSSTTSNQSQFSAPPTLAPSAMVSTLQVPGSGVPRKRSGSSSSLSNIFSSNTSFASSTQQLLLPSTSPSAAYSPNPLTANEGGLPLGIHWSVTASIQPLSNATRTSNASSGSMAACGSISKSYPSLTVPIMVGYKHTLPTASTEVPETGESPLSRVSSTTNLAGTSSPSSASPLTASKNSKSFHGLSAMAASTTPPTSYPLRVPSRNASSPSVATPSSSPSPSTSFLSHLQNLPSFLKSKIKKPAPSTTVTLNVTCVQSNRNMEDGDTFANLRLTIGDVDPDNPKLVSVRKVHVQVRQQVILRIAPSHVHQYAAIINQQQNPAAAAGSLPVNTPQAPGGKEIQLVKGALVGDTTVVVPHTHSEDREFVQKWKEDLSSHQESSTSEGSESLESPTSPTLSNVPQHQQVVDIYVPMRVIPFANSPHMNKRETALAMAERKDMIALPPSTPSIDSTFISKYALEVKYVATASVDLRITDPPSMSRNASSTSLSNLSSSLEGLKGSIARSRHKNVKLSVDIPWGSPELDVNDKDSTIESVNDSASLLESPRKSVSSMGGKSMVSVESERSKASSILKKAPAAVSSLLTRMLKQGSSGGSVGTGSSGGEGVGGKGLVGLENGKSKSNPLSPVSPTEPLEMVVPRVSVTSAQQQQSRGSFTTSNQNQPGSRPQSIALSVGHHSSASSISSTSTNRRRASQSFFYPTPDALATLITGAIKDLQGTLADVSALTKGFKVVPLAMPSRGGSSSPVYGNGSVDSPDNHGATVSTVTLQFKHQHQRGDALTPADTLMMLDEERLPHFITVFTRLDEFVKSTFLDSWTTSTTQPPDAVVNDTSSIRSGRSTQNNAPAQIAGVIWPRHREPFNHVVLELEMLLGPSPVGFGVLTGRQASQISLSQEKRVLSAGEKLMCLCIEWLEYTTLIIEEWVNARGKGEKNMESLVNRREQGQLMGREYMVRSQALKDFLEDAAAAFEEEDEDEENGRSMIEKRHPESFGQKGKPSGIPPHMKKLTEGMSASEKDLRTDSGIAVDGANA
ncbi:hypothetical protein HDV05_002950 [Chytridiales sp. JEL 0842]|nr:hypothetical protein HDV05_002950 [Chytridiales sp. JEL 0842]